MATTSRYYDGDYAVGFYDGPPLITYPFLNNTTPDRYAKQIRRTWLQRGVDYVPTNADRTSYTNLLLHSQDVTVSPWGSSGTISYSADTGTAPDGTLTGDSVADIDGGAIAFRYQDIVVANDSVTRTFSVFLKAVNGSTGQITIEYFGGSGISAVGTINWTTGAITAVAGATVDSIDCGDGWFRYSVRLANNSTGNTTARISIYPESSSAAGQSTCMIWGAQLEAASAMGCYVSTTTTTRTVSAPDMDPGDEINEPDQFAYLVSEAEQNRDIADTVKVSRLFSRIPATQTRPTSLRISKPSVSGTFPQAFSDYRIFQPDSTLTKYDAYFAQTIISDTGTPSFYSTGGTYTLTFSGSTTTALTHSANAATVETALNLLTPITNRGGVTVTGSYNSPTGFTVAFNTYAAFTLGIGSITVSAGSAYTSGPVSTSRGYVQSVQILSTAGGNVTGGTFTLTIFTQTTAAIAYNATPTAVASAINALTNVSNRGNVTVTGGGTNSIYTPFGNVSFSIEFTNPFFTGSATSMTPSGGSIVVGGTVIDQTIAPRASATRTIQFAADHGIVSTDTIYIKGGSYYSGILSSLFTIPSADTIAINVAPTDSYASAATITEAGKRTKADYAPGSGTIRASAVTSFYLPGVTAGIDTAADIPQVSDQGDQTPFLLATFAGTGTINMNVGQLQPWNGTTILSQEITTINAADV